MAGLIRSFNCGKTQHAIFLRNVTLSVGRANFRTTQTPSAGWKSAPCLTPGKRKNSGLALARALAIFHGSAAMIAARTIY
jgi:hypothetical protein